MMAVLVRVLLVWDSRANYFIGAALVIVWAMLVSAFYFLPEDTTNVVSSSASAVNIATPFMMRWH